MATVSTASTTAGRMTEAGSRFLESLSPEQRERATYHYLDGERVFWYYPPMNRHGLALRDMDSHQREFAYALMASGLTDRAYRQAKQIIGLEDVLGPLEKEQGLVTFDRDPSLYYFTVFGDPEGQEPWGWRAEGHHVSLHFSLWGDKVISSTPFFFGSNPAEVRKSPKKGLRILGAVEDLAFDLMDDLDAASRGRAVIYDTAPYDILTFNATRASLPAEEGLSVSKMSAGQKKALWTLVTEYVGSLPAELAQERLSAIEADDFGRMHFAWGGPVKKGEAHYYRIHGGNFVVEFDNRQNGANHIHSVWRNVENDFASDVLREHLLAYHVL